jgi:hypothetical protein
MMRRFVLKYARRMTTLQGNLENTGAIRSGGIVMSTSLTFLCREKTSPEVARTSTPDGRLLSSSAQSL